MAHTRAERRYKTALIKGELERRVRKQLAGHAQRAIEIGKPNGDSWGTEQEVRRRLFKNEGRIGLGRFRCGQPSCDWCRSGLYHKHLQRARALEHDLLEYVRGNYDALREEGENIPSASLTRLPPAMKPWRYKLR